MGLYGGIGAFADPITVASDKGMSSRLIQTGQIQASPVGLNTAPGQRSFFTAKICPPCSAFLSPCSLLCCQCCHPSSLVMAIAPHRALPISAPGHLLVHHLLSIPWYYAESAYHTVNGMATTVVGPMQTLKNVLSPLDNHLLWQKNQLRRETGDESSLVHD